MDKVAIIFPGQGSQFVGMAKTLCEEYSGSKRLLEEADECLHKKISDIIFHGPDYELNKVDNMLPALLTISVIIFRAFQEQTGIIPQIAAGHSLGEISANVCGGSLSFGDALRFVTLRGEIGMQIKRETDGAMTVVNNVSVDEVENAIQEIGRLNGYLAICCQNSESQVVVAGENKALIELEKKLFGKNRQITPLLASPPFHSELMKKYAGKLKYMLESVTVNDLAWPVVSNIEGKPYQDRKSVIHNLVKQIYMPVQWLQTVDYLEQCAATVIEMGPQAILSNLFLERRNNVKIFSYGQIADRQKLKEYIEAAASAGEKAQSIIKRCLSIAVCERNQNWNEKEYTEGVINPYEAVQKLQMSVEDEKRQPTIEEKQKAIDMLISVFTTKKVSAERQVCRWKQIQKETKEKLIFDDLSNVIISE